MASENATGPDSPSVFPVVGIVASEGGLDAYKKFFSAVAADSAMAFVLIPHLDPSHDSRMVEWLRKLTAMPVVEAEHEMAVEVNRIHIIPPKKFLAISDRRLQLTDPPTPRSWQTSIDFFLRSLAKDQGERAIGIILSGTGNHGAQGIRAIKLAGGMVMAQQPSSAEQEQMPQNAIDTGFVDDVLPPDKMPAALAIYVEQPSLSNGRDADAASDQSADRFETVSKQWRVSRSKDTARGDSFSHHLASTPHRRIFQDLTEQLVLNEYAPAAALVSRKLEVLYVTGPLVNYLEFPRGELTKELLAMARPGLRTKLRAACQSAIRDGNTTIDTSTRVKRSGRFVPCAIMVRPLTEPKEAQGLMLVLFRDRVSGQSFELTSDAFGDSGDTETVQAEESRLSRRLELELMSMSEELHSTIEELNNVNRQLQDKVAELDKATNDFMNLLSSTEIATIFLDEQLNIKRFTPPTKAVLNLLSTDIGRPLRDIAPKFTDDQMLIECRQVLDNHTPVEREVQTGEPRYYLRRILPYRTNDHPIGGVVITFVDLTQRKLAEAVRQQTDARHFAELHESAQRMQTILNTAADAIVTFDRLGKIDSINLATETLFKYQRDELIGQNISLLIPSIFAGQPDEGLSERINAELARIVKSRREVLARRKDGSTFPVDLAISRVDHLEIYTGILRDVSLRKQLEAHILEIASDEQRRIGQELHDGTQQELTGLSLFAGALREILGYATPSDTPGSTVWTLAENDYRRILQTVKKLTQGLQEANQHVSVLSHGILPVQIDAEGLRSALAELAAATNDQQRIQCRFEFSGSIAIASNLVATQLYRIAQESLNNAIKHGRADDILISLSQQAEQIILEICDNGVGFEPKRTPRSPRAGGGVGLRIMQYRASMLGGVLEVDLNHEHGTTVRCTIPVTGDFL